MPMPEICRGAQTFHRIGYAIIFANKPEPNSKAKQRNGRIRCHPLYHRNWTWTRFGRSSVSNSNRLFNLMFFRLPKKLRGHASTNPPMQWHNHYRLCIISADGP